MITLEKKGEKSSISLNKSIKTSDILAKLTWTDKVDLDLHAFVITKSGNFKHIYFGSKGNTNKSPYIQLDKDSGVGGIGGVPPSPAAGNNQRSSQSASSPLSAASVVRPRLGPAEHMLGDERTWIREDRESERRGSESSVTKKQLKGSCCVMFWLEWGHHVAFYLSLTAWRRGIISPFIECVGNNKVKIKRVDPQDR